MTALAFGAAMNLQPVPEAFDTSLDPVGVINAVQAFQTNDHFVFSNGATFAGSHLPRYFYNAEKLDKFALLPERYKEVGLATRSYTPELHKAAFALPAFILEAISN